MTTVVNSSNFYQTLFADSFVLVFLASMGYANFYNLINEPSTTALTILAFAFIYKLFILCATGDIKEIIATTLGTIILAVIAGFIPVIGVILVAILVISNIASALINIRLRLSDAIIASLMYYSLFFPSWYGTDKTLAFSFYIACFIVLRIKIYSEEFTQRGLLNRYALAFLSPPLIIISIISLISVLKSSFNTNVTNRTMNVTKPQAVSSHFRANGTFVDSYSRSINTKVTQSITHITPGTGVVTSTLSNAISSNNSVFNNLRSKNFYRVLIALLCLFAAFIYFDKKSVNHYYYDKSLSQTQDNDSYSQQNQQPIEPSNESQNTTQNVDAEQANQSQITETQTLTQPQSEQVNESSEPPTTEQAVQQTTQVSSTTSDAPVDNPETYKYLVNEKITYYFSDDGNSVEEESSGKTLEILKLLSQDKKIGISVFVKNTGDAARDTQFAFDLADATKSNLVKQGANTVQIELVKPDDIYQTEDGEQSNRAEIFVIS